MQIAFRDRGKDRFGNYFSCAWVGGVAFLQPELLAEAGIGLVVCCADHLQEWARPTATASRGLNGFAPR